MNYEEYLQKEKNLTIEFENNKTELMKEFIRANNPYKAGDIVTDHIGSIMIERMSFSWGGWGRPCAVYHGIELKKDGTPTKKGSRREVYQSNIKPKNQNDGNNL